MKSNSKKNEINSVLGRTHSQTITQIDLIEPKICTVPSLQNIARKSNHISANILTAYYSKVPRAESDEAFWNNIFDGTDLYSGPFEICVFGAYPIMSAWRELNECIKLAYDDTERLRITSVGIKNGLKYKTTDYKQYEKEKVLERLKNFAKGFKYGFDTFISKHIDSESAISNNDKFKIQRVIDFLNTESWGNISFQPIRFADSEEVRIMKWYDDGVAAGNDYHAWCYIFINHKFFERYFSEQQKENFPLKAKVPNTKKKTTHSFRKANHGSIEKKSSDIQIKSPSLIKSEKFIDPDFLELVVKAEVSAFDGSEKFITKIRCAAFREMLYEKRYITNTNTRIQTMYAFAKSRYKLEIKTALASAKQIDRNNHKNGKVKGMISLKNCF